MPRLKLKSFVLKSKPRLAIRAFSLVEVVIAIGVFAFAIISILGLLSVGLSTSQTASSESVLSIISQTVDTQVCQQVSTNFVNVWNGSYAPFAAASTTPHYYFDSDGKDVTANPSAAVYSCVVRCHPPGTSNPSPNLLYIEYDFRWPVAANHANPDKIVYSSLSNDG